MFFKMKFILIITLIFWPVSGKKRRIVRTDISREQIQGIALADSNERLMMQVHMEDEEDVLRVVVEKLPVLLTASKDLQVPDTFRGKVVNGMGEEIGWAALSFSDEQRQEYEGMVSIENPMLINQNELSDLPTKEGIHCGTQYHEHADVNHRFGRVERLRDGLAHVLKDTMATNGEQKCFTHRHYIYIGVAADCEFIKRLGGREKAKAHIINTYNQVSAIYETAFNLSIGIVRLHLPQDSECSDPAYLRDRAPSWNGPCLPTSTLNPKLLDFTRWCAQELADDSESGLWHLLTGCKVSGSEVGLGWIDTLGVRHVKGSRPHQLQKHVGGTAVSTLDGASLTQVIAHELGHNLGASHDCAKRCACEGITCRDCCPCASERSPCDCFGQYLMNPTTNMASLDFSPCTARQVCASLKLRPNHTYPLHVALGRLGRGMAVCGNGVKEDGEECDCGSEEQCAQDPCCMHGCKLRPDAACSDRNGACCRDCQIVRSPGVLCRPSTGPCDGVEYCDRISPDCPADSHLPDTTPCGPGLFCASGICTSRDQQCQTGAARFHSTLFCPNDASAHMRSTCHLYCLVPGLAGQPPECLHLASMLIDGTPCGERGMCHQGVCVESGVMPATGLAVLVSGMVGVLVVTAAAIYLWRR